MDNITRCSCCERCHPGIDLVNHTSQVGIDASPSGYKILFPVDFSSLSALAAQHVKMWSDRFSAVLNTLHIVEGNQNGLWYDQSRYSEQSRVVARRTADLEYFSHHHFGQNEAQAFVLAGNTADRLEAFANHEQVDLVMLPRNHHSVMARIFNESLTANLLDRCRASVWMTEHIRQNQGATVKSVLCALHFKQDQLLHAQNLRILHTVRQLVSNFGADVTFLQVTGNTKPTESWTEAGTEAGSQLWLMQAQDLLGGSIRLLCKPGSVISGIRDTVAQISADLVVVGRIRPEAITFGRQSRILKIDHVVRCPVLSVW